MEEDAQLARRLQLECDEAVESDELSVITRVAQEESSFRFALALQQQAQRALLGKPLGDALSDEDLHLVLQQLGFANVGASTAASAAAAATASPDLAMALELARKEAAEHRLNLQQPQPQQQQQQQQQQQEEEEERRQQEEKGKKEEREAQQRQRQQQRKAIDQLAETLRRGLAQQQATADEHARRKKERAEAEEQKAKREREERDRRFAEDEDRRIAALRRREKESGWEAPPVWPPGVRFIMRNEEAWAEDLDDSAHVGTVDAGPAEGGDGGSGGAMPALHHHHRRSAKQTTAAGSAQVIAEQMPRMLDQIRDIRGKPNNSGMVELRQLGEGHPAYKPDVFKYRRNGGRSYGVFAKVFIPKQTVIAQYCGLLVQASEESSGAYRLPINNRTDIDAEMAGNESRCINDYRGTGRRHNVQFYPHPNRPEHWVVSLADIQKGDELLLDYGEDYWKDIDEAEKNAQHEDEDYVASSDSSSVATNRNVTPKRLRSSRSSLNVSQLLARQRVLCAACCVTAKINGSGWVDVGGQGTQTLDIWWAQHNKTWQCTALLPEATDDLDATGATPADGAVRPRGWRKMRAERRDTAMQRHLMVLVGDTGSPVPLSQFIDEATAADTADVTQKCAAEKKPQHKKAKQARARKAAASPEWAVIRNQDVEIDQEEENENENEDEAEEENESESESESESEDKEGKQQPDVSTSASPAKDHSPAPMVIDADGVHGAAAAEWQEASFARQPGTTAMPLGSTRAGTPAATRRKAPVTRWHMEESDGKPVCIIDDDDADRNTFLSSSSSSTTTTPTSTAVYKDPESATIVDDDDGDDDDSDVDDEEEEDVYVAVTRSGKRKAEIDLLAGEVSDKGEDDEDEDPLIRKPKRPYTSDLPAAPPTTSFPSAPTSSSATRPPAPSRHSSSSSSSSSASITSVPSSAFPVSHSLSSLFAPSSSQRSPGLVQTLSVPSPPVSASSSLPSSPLVAASSPEFIDFFVDLTPSTSPAPPSPPSSEAPTSTTATTPASAKTPPPLPPFTIHVPTAPPTAPSPPSPVSTPTWRQLLAAMPSDPAALAAQTGEMSRVEILAALQTLASLTTSLVSSLARK